MKMTSKGPRTYRRQYPGQHVVALLVVDPKDTDILIERPVSEEIAKQLLKILVDDMQKTEPSPADFCVCGALKSEHTDPRGSSYCPPKKGKSP